MTESINIGDTVELKSVKTISKSLWGLQGKVVALVGVGVFTHYEVSFMREEVKDYNFSSLLLNDTQIRKVHQ